MLVSANKLCKQFGPRQGLTTSQACSGSKLFDTQMVFLEEFFEKVNFEQENQQMTKMHAKLFSMQRVKHQNTQKIGVPFSRFCVQLYSKFSIAIL